MLSRLRVKNLALVENIAVEFKAGLNIITGETGAGKSILIGALNLLLGERADKSVIRTGEDACGVEAVFDLEEAGEVDAALEEYGLDPCEDGQLVIRRIVKASGSGQNLVNDTAVTLTVLRRLGELLVDMHGPHQHQSLLNNNSQLDLLDSFGGLWDSRRNFERDYRELQDLQQRRADLEMDDEAVADQVENLSFRVKEIEDAEIHEGEDEEVEQEHAQAGNAHRILELSNSVVQVLTGDEHSVFNQLTGIHAALEELSRLLPDAAQWREEIESITSQIQEISSDISSHMDEASVNPARLSWLEQRLATFQRLKRKYGATLGEVMETLEQSRSKLEDLQTRDERIKELDAEILSKRREMMNVGKELRTKREAVAVELANAVTRELQALGFERGEFSVEINECDPSVAGIDEIEFGFAPNVGEKMRPLRKIASSGEISRVMLACKAVLARHDRIPILIFDEIDANLGGEMAHPVGAKLAEVAKAHQVVSITHLPQVAVCGDSHFTVVKYVRNERTFSNIEEVEGDARIGEIARMLGDANSRTARSHAQEMLAAFENDGSA